MSQTTTSMKTGFTAETATQVVGRYAAADETKALADPGLAPPAFVNLLAGKGLHTEAIKALAHAIPPREAVWWACLCVRRAAGLGKTPPREQIDAQAAAEAWVSDPSEPNRRAAQAAADLAGLATPAGCAAVAAFWSGGSLGPPDVPAIPPGPYLTAHGAACAVILATVTTTPEKAPDAFAADLALGLEVAAGKHPWPEAPRQASAPDASSSSVAPKARPVVPFSDPDPMPRAAGPGPMPAAPAGPQGPARRPSNWD
ncbi:hypothetical protein EP7_002438 [Isosphaeraceae bacterium EP7]